MPIPPKHLIVMVVGLVLTACQVPPSVQVVIPGDRAAPPAADRPAEPDTCGAKPYSWLIGENRKRIPQMPAGSVVRVVCSTCPMTMDFNASRLNIVYDEKTGVVDRLSCG